VWEFGLVKRSLGGHGRFESVFGRFGVLGRSCAHRSVASGIHIALSRWWEVAATTEVKFFSSQ
jgi:hypothetical protein